MRNTITSPRRHGGHGEARRIFVSSVYLRVLRASVVKILILGIGLALSNVSLQAEERLATGDAGKMAQELFAAKANFVSPGAIQLAKGTLGFKNGLLVRDPDGRAIQLVEKEE